MSLALLDLADHPPSSTLTTYTYASKRVLVTGHTGFVGTWLTTWLEELGASVSGLSLPDDIGRPYVASDAMAWKQPEVVFHLAAQALVGHSYHDPLYTLNTNVMGTARLLDAVHLVSPDTTVVVITSDKCYAPNGRSHNENDHLGGDDPYSASKGCAELVAHAYRESYGLNIATARAGNIIGGGDWAEDRLVPDCVRAAKSGKRLQLRNPTAIRPFQHVLDAVHGYLMLGAALMDDPSFRGAWNFGPDEELMVGDLVKAFGVEYVGVGSRYPESPCLRLDTTKAWDGLGWRPLLKTNEMVEWTQEWYAADHDMTLEQVRRYVELIGGAP